MVLLDSVSASGDDRAVQCMEAPPARNSMQAWNAMARRRYMDAIWGGMHWKLASIKGTGARSGELLNVLNGL